MDKLIPAQGVGHHTFGGKKLHNDVIFPDFSSARSTTTSAPAPSPIQAPETPETQPVPEPANHSSPETGAETNAPVTGQAANPGANAEPGPPAISRDRKGRLAAPPFSWLGGDAWPHFPACADHQA
jgi:hypothetical protein